MTTKEITGDRVNGGTKWRRPEREPTVIEKKAMVGRMLEIGVKMVMRNNYYRFGGDIRLQGEGGAIGVQGFS